MEYGNAHTAGNEYRSEHMMADLPVQERPRERLLYGGAGALADHELLAILLRTGAKDRSVRHLAMDVLKAFDGNLSALATAEISELCAVRGVGEAKAIELRAAFALAHRLSTRPEIDRPAVQSPQDAADIFREHFLEKEKEEFHVILLDTKHFVIRTEPVTVGLVDRSQIHPREVFRSAIRNNCSRIVLIHNHPSGDPTPSKQDIAATKNLVKSGEIIGIEVLDHVVMGKRTDHQQECNDFLSFREEKLLS